MAEDRSSATRWPTKWSARSTTTSPVSVCRPAWSARRRCAPRCSTTGSAISSHKHPDAVVVDLGAGLDSGFYRVDPPPSVDWYSVDLPGIIALRDEVLPANPHSHSVPVSLAEKHWPDTIPADRPTMLVADGLFAFLSEPVIVSIFRRITDHFGSGELAFNDYGGIGWFSRLAIKLYPQKMFKDVGSQWGYLGFKDAHHPETWNPQMTLVEEASLAHAPEVDLFPGWIRIPTKLMGKSKTGARKARILRYRF